MYLEAKCIQTKPLLSNGLTAVRCNLAMLIRDNDLASLIRELLDRRKRRGLQDAVVPKRRSHTARYLSKLFVPETVHSSDTRVH